MTEDEEVLTSNDDGDAPARVAQSWISSSLGKKSVASSDMSCR